MTTAQKNYVGTLTMISKWVEAAERELRAAIQKMEEDGTISSGT